MSGAGEPQEEHQATPGPRRLGGSGGRLFQIVLGIVVMIILLVTALWGFTHTRSFQGWVTDALWGHTGQEWTIEKSRVQWPLDLVCTGVTMRELQSGRGGAVAAREVRVGLRAGGGLDVEIVAPRVVLMQGAGGRWSPEFLQALAMLDRVEDTAALLHRFRPNLHIAVRGGMLRQTDATGIRTLLEVDGLDFDSIPLAVPRGGEMRYYRLRADRVLGPGDELLGTNVRREWVSRSGRPYVEVEYSGFTAAERPGYGFWSRPSVRANAGGQER